MEQRPFDPDRDRESCRRIWEEIAWIEKGNEQHAAALDLFLGAGRTLVADMRGAAECLVASAPGVIRHLEADVPMAAVTAVTTSRVARRRGLARRLAASLIVADVADGAALSILGMFEQGFYDSLGFGSGAYVHRISFDPAHLTVRTRSRMPIRLTKQDGAKVHAALLARHRWHGACNLLPETFTTANMAWTENGFGLGYCDGPGRDLTHFLWFSAKGERGPYSVRAMAFRTWDQFLELMALLRSLSDQVHLVTLQEPSGIQMQDLLDWPLKHRQVTRKTEFESAHRAGAYWQARVCDLYACLERTCLPGDGLRFNLRLTDPIEKHLPKDAAWRGVAGAYVVSLGGSSGAEEGTDESLPTLDASVNAFTRLWLGVRPASGLAVTDDLAGPPELLEALDWTLRLPSPQPDWEF